MTVEWVNPEERAKEAEKAISDLVMCIMERDRQIAIYKKLAMVAELVSRRWEKAAETGEELDGGASALVLAVKMAKAEGLI